VLLLRAEPTDRLLLRHYKVAATVPDSLSALREVRELVRALQGDAYLTASADEVRWNRDTVRVRLYVGERFRWAYLRNGNLGDGLLTRAGYREKFFRQTPFVPDDWAKLQERILVEAENQGYPFATVGLDSVHLSGHDIAGRVVLKRGPVVMFDSLQLVGNTKTKKRFLTKYLQIFPNQPFSQQRVAAAAQLLRQLPYVKLRAEPEIRFAQGRARVYLLLDDRPGSGPLAALTRAIGASTAPVLLALAVDMPLVRPELLRLLIERLLAGLDSGDLAVVPRVGGVEQPLCAAYAATLAPRAEAALATGRRDLRALFVGPGIRFLDEPDLRHADPDLRSFASANTPEEWAAMLRSFREYEGGGQLWGALSEADT